MVFLTFEKDRCLALSLKSLKSLNNRNISCLTTESLTRWVGLLAWSLLPALRENVIMKNDLTK